MHTYVAVRVLHAMTRDVIIARLHPPRLMPLRAFHLLPTILSQVASTIFARHLAPPCKRDHDGGEVVVAAHVLCIAEDALRSIFGGRATPHEVRDLLI